MAVSGLVTSGDGWESRIRERNIEVFKGIIIIQSSSILQYIPQNVYENWPGDLTCSIVWWCGGEKYCVSNKNVLKIFFHDVTTYRSTWRLRKGSWRRCIDHKFDSFLGTQLNTIPSCLMRLKSRLSPSDMYLQWVWVGRDTKVILFWGGMELLWWVTFALKLLNSFTKLS